MNTTRPLSSVIRPLLALLCALCVSTFAAEAPNPAPAAPDTQLRSAAAILRAQRDSNAQQTQDLQVQLQLALAEVETLKAQLADTKAKLAALTPPDATAPAAAKPTATQTRSAPPPGARP